MIHAVNKLKSSPFLFLFYSFFHNRQTTMHVRQWQIFSRCSLRQRSVSSPTISPLLCSWLSSQSFVRRHHHHHHHRPLHTHTQSRRSFHIPSLSSLFSSSATDNKNDNNNNNNNNDNDNSGRTLSATRVLMLPPSPLFEIIASVDSYSSFLPFMTTSTVTARDPASGYPTQAI